jgi:hypothetical protein
VLLKKMRIILPITVILPIMINSAYADTVENPCGGADNLLNLVDRPTNAPSACTVSMGRVEFESGVFYKNLTYPGGIQWNFPNSELRIGLPKNTEFTVLLPTYNHQSIPPSSGFSQTTAGIKHELWFTNKWLITALATVNLPDGSAAFGNKSFGAAFNGIISYTFNSKLNLTVVMSGSTTTEPRQSGGQRYNSFNPDCVLTYASTDKLNVYAEVYGQSNTGPGQGSGYNLDAGVLYLIRPNMVIDLSGGQRLSGNLGGFENYINAGFSILI